MRKGAKGIMAAVATLIVGGSIATMSLPDNPDKTMENSVHTAPAVTAVTVYEHEPVTTEYSEPVHTAATVVTVTVTPDETLSAHVERENDVSQSAEHTLQTIIVYVSSAGKYHRNKDCSGMKNSTAMDMDAAIYDGYVPCRKCYTTVYPENVEQAKTELPVGEDIVYVSSTGKYHVRSDCSGMKQSTAMTREQADAAGHVPCKRCY